MYIKSIKKQTGFIPLESSRKQKLFTKNNGNTVISSKTLTGFTIVEALVALFILSVALGGALAVIFSQVSSITLATNNFIAGSLLQEAEEIARNLRDSDWLAGNPFGTSLPAGNYRVQWNSTALISEADTPLLMDTNGFLNYDNGTATNFYRTIAISQPFPYEIIAVVNVSWKNRSLSHSFSSELHLYNWNE